MIKEKIRDFFAFLSRTDPRQNDNVDVEQVQSLSAALSASEIIVWEGRPSHHYAWADHDQMEPAGATGAKPNSIMGRVILYFFIGFFITITVFIGLYTLVNSIQSLMEAKNFENIISSIGIILFAITLIALLPLLLTPFANIQRSKQLAYAITTRRTLIIREGPAWSEIWIKTPIIICVSLLFLYAVAYFGLLFIFSSYQDYINGAGLNTWFARVFIILFVGPIGLIFALFGWIGLTYQTVIIQEAIKSKSAIYIRSFYFNDIKKLGLPVISRIRKTGVGDVILGSDGHWEYGNELSSFAPEMFYNSVGFLSIADAKNVAKKIHIALTTI